jgi:hypothetical protein
MADFNLSSLRPTEFVRYRVVSASTTLSNLDYCVVTNANCTITLPSSPINGSKVLISSDVTSALDYVGGKINIIVATPSTETIEGLTDDFVIDVNDVSVIFVYNTTSGWRIS